MVHHINEGIPNNVLPLGKRHGTGDSKGQGITPVETKKQRGGRSHHGSLKALLLKKCI